MNESDGDKRGRRRQWAVVIAIVLAPLLLIAWLILFWDIKPPDESAALPLRPLTVRSENEPLAVFVRDWSAAADAFGDEWSAAVRTESPLFTGEAGVEKELAVVYERHHKLADAFLRLADEDAPLLWLGVDDQIDMGMTLSEVKELQNSAKASVSISVTG